MHNQTRHNNTFNKQNQIEFFHEENEWSFTPDYQSIEASSLSERFGLSLVYDATWVVILDLDQYVTCVACTWFVGEKTI